MSRMSQIEQILTLARAYASAEGVELSTVSWRVFGDTKKLRALDEGGDLHTRRASAALAWFGENWPDGADWPQGIERGEVA
jgi:hypothetical protein